MPVKFCSFPSRDGKRIICRSLCQILYSLLINYKKEFMSNLIENARWIWCGDDPSDQHVWVYARHRFDIRTPAKAFIEISADLRYFFWINGTPIGFGPPKFHDETPTFDRYPLNGILHVGENTLTVLIYSLGAKLPLSSCMPKRGALRAALVHADGVVLTDRAWRMRRERAYQDETIDRGEVQPPVECFDARNSLGLPWEKDYNDSAWAPAAELGPATPGERMEARDIPLFGWRFHESDRVVETGVAQFHVALDREHMTSLPADIQHALRIPSPHKQVIVMSNLGGAGDMVKFDASALPANQGCYAIWDFGRIWTGYPEITLSGTPGTVVDLSYGEHLTNGHINPTKHIPYCDRIVLGDGLLRHRITWPKCLRYLQVDLRAGQATVHQLGLQRSAYPVQRQGSFASSDPVLDQAWEISIHTVELCMEDGYMDTPWRERGSWLGDDLIKWQANEMVFGDYPLMRRFLLQHSRGQLPDGSMCSKYPGNKSSHISTWTLCFAVSLLDYVEASDDIEFARQMWPVVAKTAGWLARYTTDEGLYGNLPVQVDATTNIYNFIDWAPIDMRGSNAAWNAFAYRFLQIAERLAALVGDSRMEAECRRRADDLKHRFRDLFWDPCRGIFVNGRVDGQPLRRWGCQENYLAVLFGLTDDAQQSSIIARLRQEDLTAFFVPDERDYDMIVPECGKMCGVAIAYSKYRWPDDKMVPLGTAYFAGYAVQALCELGMITEALDFMRKRWGEFSRQGATTVWETWSMDSSLSHGWACAPVVMLGRYLIGVRRSRGGPHDIEILPQFGDVTSARGRVTTRQGVVQVSWTALPTPRMDVVIPASMTALAGLPCSAATQLRVDDRPCDSTDVLDRYNRSYRCVRLGAGRHQITEAVGS